MNHIIIISLSTHYCYDIRGNISSMVVNIPKLGSTKTYNYNYDQLNRIAAMDVFNGLNVNNGTFTPISINDYKEKISYDPNGNILSYLRNGTSSSLNLNNYAYSYTPETNRLSSITNSVNSNTGIYNYDAIGNVIKDEKQNVNNADWNVYGKLQSVTKTNNTQINYTYNTAGARVSKAVNDTTEFYVRDASGNILAVYKKEGSGVLKQTEINLYGSSMLGSVSELSVLPQEIILQGGFANGVLKTFTRGEKEYLLTDHRANNMVSVSDRRQQYSVDNTTVNYYLADIKTASYYSSFGAISNSYNSNAIKYAFNGQRRSTEISGFAQTAEFWEYNADVGRRWNRDVKPAVGISEYSAFGNNPINKIDLLGDTLIDNNGKAINYTVNKNGSLEWSKNVTDDWKKIGNNMAKTKTGLGVLNDMKNAEWGITMKVSPDNHPTAYGTTLPHLKTWDSKAKTGTIKSVDITIYEGAIKEMQSETNSGKSHVGERGSLYDKLFKLNDYEGAVGAVASHEGTHGSTFINLIDGAKNSKLNEKNDTESLPNSVETKVLKEKVISDIILGIVLRISTH